MAQFKVKTQGIFLKILWSQISHPLGILKDEMFMLKKKQKKLGMGIFFYFPSILFGFLDACYQQNILASSGVLRPHLQV